MSERPVRLQVLKGTTLWLPSGGRQEVNAADGAAITDGGRIRTAPDSKAFLSLFDGSNVTLWPDTTVRVMSTQSTTYSDSNTLLVLAQDQGHARYAVAIPVTSSRRFELTTPQASVLLREGSYKVDVTANTTVVTVSAGSATVSAGDHAVEVLRGEWVTVANGGLPSKPGPSIHSVVANGDFSQGFESWQPGNRGVEDGNTGNVSIQVESNQPFAEFERSGSSKHGEDFIHQPLNQDVTDDGILKLNFQLRIKEQTLSGGGMLGSEYPLIVRIHYRDSAGNEQDWMHGYYIQNYDGHPTPSADAVIPDQWTDESFDLFDPNVVSPRPSEILWIEVAASGHGFRSDVSRIELLTD